MSGGIYQQFLEDPSTTFHFARDDYTHLILVCNSKSCQSRLDGFILKKQIANLSFFSIPADFIAFFRKFLFIKEAVVLAVQAQYLEDTITIMGQNNFETEVTTTTGEEVEIVTQSLGEIINSKGQTMAAIDLGSYVLAIEALEKDATMTAYFSQTPGYRNVTLTIQEELSFAGMNNSNMVIKAMQYGLTNSQLQTNLQFEGNPKILPR